MHNGEKDLSKADLSKYELMDDLVYVLSWLSLRLKFHLKSSFGNRVNLR